MSASAVWRKGSSLATIYIDGKRASSIPVPSGVQRIDCSGSMVYLYADHLCYLYECGTGYPRHAGFLNI